MFESLNVPFLEVPHLDPVMARLIAFGRPFELQILKPPSCWHQLRSGAT